MSDISPWHCPDQEFWHTSLFHDSSEKNEGQPMNYHMLCTNHRRGANVSRRFNPRQLAIFSLLLACSWAASADGFDLRDLDISAYSYPSSDVITSRRDQYDVNLELLSPDPSDRVVQFYKDMGLRERDGSEPGWGGVVVPGTVFFEKHMVATHVPLYVTVFGRPQYDSVSDSDLYGELESFVVLGKHTNDELEAVRRRFDVLKTRFYKDKPRQILQDCKAPGDDAMTEKVESMEERSLRLQELAMQGRFEELRKETESLNRQHQDLADEANKDRWDEQIGCLEKLESEAYQIRIELTASRDDVAG